MEFFKLYKGDYMYGFIKRTKKYRTNKDISIEELKNIIDLNNKAVLLDVRSPQEYNEGHLNRRNKHSFI